MHISIVLNPDHCVWCRASLHVVQVEDREGVAGPCLNKSPRKLPPPLPELPMALASQCRPVVASLVDPPIHEYMELPAFVTESEIVGLIEP